MRIDAWLFASAFTVNTESTRKKKTTMRANEEASRINIHNDAKPQQMLLKESKRLGRRHLKEIYRYTERYPKGRVSVST